MLYNSIRWVDSKGSGRSLWIIFSETWRGLFEVQINLKGSGRELLILKLALETADYADERGCKKLRNISGSPAG